MKDYGFKAFGRVNPDPGWVLGQIRSRYDKVVIELGAGKGEKYDGTVYVDISEKASPRSDIIVDLEDGIPLPDGCVDLLHSNQLLEHIHNIIPLMNEIYRVLKIGGKTWHRVPYFLSPHSVGDPTHVRQFSEESFKYYCNGFADSFSDYGITARFKKYMLKKEGHGLYVEFEK